MPIALAVSGPQSVRRFAPLADAMVAVEPEPEAVAALPRGRRRRGCRRSGSSRSPGTPTPRWRPTRAHELFRWFGGGWKVNAELPGTAGFAGATQFVRPEDVSASIPCGPDVAAQVEAVRPFVDAGFSHVALAQIGGDTQPEFLRFAERELLPALRAEYGEGKDSAIRPRDRE